MAASLRWSEPRSPAGPKRLGDPCGRQYGEVGTVDPPQRRDRHDPRTRCLVLTFQQPFDNETGIPGRERFMSGADDHLLHPGHIQAI